jgi:hypothetical protein
VRFIFVTVWSCDSSGFSQLALKLAVEKWLALGQTYRYKKLLQHEAEVGGGCDMVTEPILMVRLFYGGFYHQLSLPSTLQFQYYRMVT